MEIAKITPIRKQGDHTNVNNLRPIALLPLPGKIAERLFRTQRSEHLEHYNLLNPNQYSFQKNKSTLDFTDDVLLDINEV